MYANIIATISLLVTILSIPGFIKNFKGFTMKQLRANPNTKIIFFATLVTLTFYIVPFPEIHFGKLPSQNVRKVHDTIYIYKHTTIHDTVYRYIKAPTKKFYNKIGEVNKLDEH